MYPKPRFKAHPQDCSVMQYTGHEVLRTLIRCHFSPAETTGGQYIYSGSADGRIHVSVSISMVFFDVDLTLVRRFGPLTAAPCRCWIDPPRCPCRIIHQIHSQPR